MATASLLVTAAACWTVWVRYSAYRAGPASSPTQTNVSDLAARVFRLDQLLTVYAAVLLAVLALCCLALWRIGRSWRRAAAAGFRSMADRLRAAERKYRSLFDGTRDAVMLLDVGGLLDCNQAAADLFGCSTREELLEYRQADLSPAGQPDGRDSRTALAERLAEAFRDGAAHFPWTCRRADGSEFPAEILLTRVDAGRRAVIQAIVADVTETHAVEQAERQSRAFLQTVIDAVEQSTIVVAPDHRILLANASARKRAGGADPVAEGWTCHQLLHRCNEPCRNEAEPCPLQEVLETGEAVTVSHVHRDAQGGEAFVDVTAVPVLDESGQVVSVVQSVCDLTELRRCQRQLAHLACHDALTGLPNRKLFQEALDRAVAKARRGTPGVLLMIDVDHFKEINDAVGHGGGDEVLVRLVRLMAGCLRTEDVLARLGGDEFAVLLEGADLAQGTVIAERIRAAVTEAAFARDLTVPPSLSIGLAAVADSWHGEGLLIQADAAMYRAKQSGRNRVICHAAL